MIVNFSMFEGNYDFSKITYYLGSVMLNLKSIQNKSKTNCLELIVSLFLNMTL